MKIETKFNIFLIISFFCIIILMVSSCSLSRATLAYASAEKPEFREVVDSNHYNLKDSNPISLTDTTIINNGNYFVLNPNHHRNGLQDSRSGLCTTVAMQLLLGYHNYYSDRRIIPAVSSSGTRFINVDYGEVNHNPVLLSACSCIPAPSGSIDMGCKVLGVENTVFDELRELTTFGEVDGLGQILPLVVDGAKDFLDLYCASTIRDDIIIDFDQYSRDMVIAELNNNRPVILGCGSDEIDGSHVVVAYGYAKHNGVDGYIVHCGWGKYYSYVWTPASWYAYQVTMSVNTTHSFVDDSIDFTGGYRQIHCSDCNAVLLDEEYILSSDEKEIIGINYPLVPNCIIPETSYNGITIESIGQNAFKNSTTLSTCDLPESIKTIGESAFEGCANFTNFTGDIDPITVGNYAFKNCSSLKRRVFNEEITNNRIGQRKSIVNESFRWIFSFHISKFDVR